MLTTESIVYQEAVRGITQQLAQLDELRTRASFLLAANGVSASFLGVVATRNGVGAFGGFAIVAFTVAASCCVWVMIPRQKGWTFELRADVLLREHVDVPARNDPAKLYRFLAEWSQTHHDKNAEPLENLFKVFWVGTVALALEIFLWLLELAI